MSLIRRFRSVPFRELLFCPAVPLRAANDVPVVEPNGPGLSLPGRVREPKGTDLAHGPG